jgi:hypothetical protein
MKDAVVFERAMNTNVISLSKKINNVCKFTKLIIRCFNSWKNLHHTVIQKNKEEGRCAQCCSDKIKTF